MLDQDIMNNLIILNILENIFNFRLELIHKSTNQNF